MSSVDTYNQLGEKIGTTKLSTKAFGVELKAGLIHRVVQAMRANLRRSTAHTKTRGEVRGGGKKPWRQKGTGRARAGSIRSPLWRGGGKVFGPRKERNYSQKINKKVKAQAFKMALTDKVKNQKLIILDDIKIENLKTKEFQQIIKKLPVQNHSCAFIYSQDELNLQKIARNINQVEPVSLNNLNLLDILRNEYLLITKSTLKHLEDRLIDNKA